MSSPGWAYTRWASHAPHRGGSWGRRNAALALSVVQPPASGALTLCFIRSLPNDNKISDNKIRKISKFYCHEISQEKQRFGQFSINFPLPQTPSKTQILLILSFRRLWFSSYMTVVHCSIVGCQLLASVAGMAVSPWGLSLLRASTQTSDVILEGGGERICFHADKGLADRGGWRKEIPPTP